MFLLLSFLPFFLPSFFLAVALSPRTGAVRFAWQNPPWEMWLAEIKPSSSVSIADETLRLRNIQHFTLWTEISFSRLSCYFFSPGRGELVMSPHALALNLRYFSARVTQMEKAFPCAPVWDRSGGFPPKQVMCSSQGNGAAHLEKHHGSLFLLLLATRGRRWWFTSLHPVLLAATLSKKSRKAPLLEMAA